MNLFLQVPVFFFYNKKLCDELPQSEFFKSASILGNGRGKIQLGNFGNVDLNFQRIGDEGVAVTAGIYGSFLETDVKLPSANRAALFAMSAISFRQRVFFHNPVLSLRD